MFSRIRCGDVQVCDDVKICPCIDPGAGAGRDLIELAIKPLVRRRDHAVSGYSGLLYRGCYQFQARRFGELLLTRIEGRVLFELEFDGARKVQNVERWAA